MKNKIVHIIIIGVFGLFLIQSCEMIVDIDTTNNLSSVSTKPVIELLGEPIIEMQVGGAYTEEGIHATAGDTVLEYTIVEGNVNSNVEGYYVVTYEAVNGFGWSSRAYRAVLVHDGSPYGDDITGTYFINYVLPVSTINKSNINGYWQISNVWGEGGVDFPITFADNGNGTYGVVPDTHPTKGFYLGTGIKTGNNINFILDVVSPGGIKTQKTFLWKRQ